MLQIRTPQFESFQRVLLEQYVETTVNRLLEHFPDPCASLFNGRDQVKAFVTRGIDNAIGLNVNTPSAITALLELWLQFGDNFERSPVRAWAMNMLSHPDLPGATKVDVIRDRHLELTGGCVMVVY
jgi:hypothetical protein